MVPRIHQTKTFHKTVISFSSSNTQFYESRIFCLFTFWVFFPDKSFKLISKYTQKCQYKKTLCNTLNWGSWNSEFVKWGVHWAEWDEILYIMYVPYLPNLSTFFVPIILHTHAIITRSLYLFLGVPILFLDSPLIMQKL